MGKNKGGQRARHHSRSGDGAAPAARPAAHRGEPRRAGLLLHSNAPWTGTGYGVQAAALAKAIQGEGRAITFSCNYGLQGGISGWEGIEVLPTGFHPYSADILTAHTRHTEATTGEPTALLTLFDCWVYEGAKIDELPVVASWVPVDHLPAPPKVLEWCQRPNVLPIAMARFGLEQLARADIEAMYAPHGVDVKTFTPKATVDGRSGRKLLSIPEDAFLVGMVAANKGTAPMRKAWGENLLAMGKLMADRDDVWLYLHTEKRGAQGGADLAALAEACGIPSERTVWCDQWSYYAGLSQEVLAALMSSFDVHLLCSKGEGFGVPVLEAAACGTPSIVSNFTAQPELAIGPEWVVDVQPEWDAAQKAWFCAPLVHSIVERLEHAYELRGDELPRSEARSLALGYSHEVVFDAYWRPILDEIDLRMTARSAP